MYVCSTCVMWGRVRQYTYIRTGMYVCMYVCTYVLSVIFSIHTLQHFELIHCDFLLLPNAGIQISMLPHSIIGLMRNRTGDVIWSMTV